MKYNTREDFIRDIGIRKLGLVDFIVQLEQDGKTEREIQAEMIRNNVSKTPRSLDTDWKFYQKIRPSVKWI